MPYYRQSPQNAQNIQNVQNVQNMQGLQNMQNIQPAQNTNYMMPATKPAALPAAKPQGLSPALSPSPALGAQFPVATSPSASPSTSPALPSGVTSGPPYGGLGDITSGEPAPVTLQSPAFIPGYLRTQLGRRMRVEFLIGTSSVLDRTGTLVGVGASYILLQLVDSDDIMLCDLFAIKFVTILL